jgi:DNA-binding MarR family transcriptional regulator
MIFTLIGHKWLQGEILTVKQVATYFGAFISDVTVTRHLDDMVASGTLVRRPDPRDRRRLLLMPTHRLFEIGRIFLEARKDIARKHGFVYDPERAKAEQSDC